MLKKGTPRAKDVEECVSAISRQARTFEKRAAEEDPWTVAEMLALRDEFDAMATRTVQRLRDTGYTWRDIGVSLGLNPIQTHKKFAHKFGDAYR